jgi:hypothetical protein
VLARLRNLFSLAEKLAPHGVLFIAYIEQNGVYAPHSAHSLTSSLAIMTLALGFLCCLHVIMIVLWARHTLNHRHFELSKLNIAAQAIVIISQICTVGALGLLSYGLQRTAANKFIRQGEFPFLKAPTLWLSNSCCHCRTLAEQTVQGM